MTPAQLALRRPERRLVEWLDELEAVGDAHREEYAALAAALAQIVPALAPENGAAMLTTSDGRPKLAAEAMLQVEGVEGFGEGWGDVHGDTMA